MEAEMKNLKPQLAVFESRGLNGLEPNVEALKRAAAHFMWEIDQIPHHNPEELLRYKSLAKTSLEESVMWAVKACSRTQKSASV